MFQRSRSQQSAAIERATGSPLTHMGLVLPHDGHLMVVEAVEPVRWTEWDAWGARAVAGTVEVRRLSDPTPLTAGVLLRMAEVAEGMLGKHYDDAFSWSDERIYCSELVYKVFDRGGGLQVGRLRALRDFNLRDAVVSAALRERYRAAVPLDETVIAPSDMAADPQLTAVRE